MSITPGYFRSLFPEYGTLSNAVVQPKIDEAVIMTCLDVPDPELVDELDTYNLSLLYLTAHLLYPSYGGGAATSGPVTSRTDGRVSVTFADRGAAYEATGPNSSTPYGIRYDDICRSQGQCLLVV